MVFGLPRGGVPVARVVADSIQAPLDVLVARKLGVPGMPEVALGAIAEGRHDVVEDVVRWYLGVPGHIVARIAGRERNELRRRARLYRAGAPLPSVRDRTVLLVDDGLASGTTLRAAALAVRRGKPARVVAAVPVASRAHCDEVRSVVDELAVVATPDPFETVSAWYDDFTPVTDDDVLRLLSRSASPTGGAGGTGSDIADERAIAIPIAPADGGTTQSMVGDLGMPNGGPAGLVILAHGGGSSRNSYRNRYLAGRLRHAGWATLRMDLLLEHEQADDVVDGRARFDIPRLAGRLVCAMDWAARECVPGSRRPFLFGASTGAAAALVAAAIRADVVAGVASRGGRVDLAGESLAAVRAPVLMIVGSEDVDTLRRTREAAGSMRCPQRLTVVAGAGHTFDEPGTLGPVGEHVVQWLESREGMARFAPIRRVLRWSTKLSSLL